MTVACTQALGGGAPPALRLQWKCRPLVKILRGKGDVTFDCSTKVLEVGRSFFTAQRRRLHHLWSPPPKLSTPLTVPTSPVSYTRTGVSAFTSPVDEDCTLNEEITTFTHPREKSFVQHPMPHTHAPASLRLMFHISPHLTTTPQRMFTVPR